jgi:Fe-S cluster assembly protein SufD
MDTAVNTKNIISDYIDCYNKNQKVLFADYPDFIRHLHEEGIEEFNKLGIPGKKTERYKYTYLEPYFSKEYKFETNPRDFNFEINEVFKCDVPFLETDVVLLVNGFYYFKNQINGSLPGNIWIGSLKKAFKEKPELLEQYFGKYATYDDGLIALNSALFLDGIFIYVPKNSQIDKPLQIINILLSEDNLMVHQRNLIILDDNSSASIVICDHTLTDKNHLTNSVTEIYVGEGAHFNQTSLQNEHNEATKISSTFLFQKSNSFVTNNVITLHGGMVRNNIKAVIDGEYAETNISGLYLTDKQQHVDNYIFVNHAKPNCRSNQFFKGVLDDNSSGSFYGRILVSRDAQKTNAYQKSSSLLLTTEAKMSARPQLEIYADDVKCSHGGTVGQLDQEALFYLRSRGISKEEAKLLLMFAFAHEIIDHIDIKPLKERIDDLVNKRLRGELSRCKNCSIHCC